MFGWREEIIAIRGRYAHALGTDDPTMPPLASTHTSTEKGGIMRPAYRAGAEVEHGAEFGRVHIRGDLRAVTTNPGVFLLTELRGAPL